MHIIIMTSYSARKRKTNQGSKHNHGLFRARAFDVGPQHLLVAQGEARGRQVVTGRVINCLMSGSTSLPALPHSISLLSNSFLQSPISILLQAICKLRSPPLIVFLLSTFSLHVLANQNGNGEKSSLNPVLPYEEERE